MGRQVQRQVRRRLGQVSRARLCARQGNGLDSAERPADAAAGIAGFLGQHPGKREAIPAPADGGLRRLHRARRSQAGRLIDEIERLGYGDNTLIFYIWGDNGSSAEGQNGTISELLAQNGIPTTIQQHLKALNELGGLDALGSPKTDNMYHAGWAWAGSTPYKATKLVASHFGGTRNPMAVRWPAKIKPDATPRPQFHHVNDIVPTIYEIVGITPPRVVNGIPQDPFDGVSMAYTFADAKAKGRKTTQYFEIMGSRAIYHERLDGVRLRPARRRGPPGLPPGIKEWTPDKDKWELYNLDEDWSQANDLADKMPAKLEELKQTISCRSDQEQRASNRRRSLDSWSCIRNTVVPPYKEWTFAGNITRMPEVTAPALGNKDNLVTIDADVPANANGVLYALGAFSGGLTCYVKDGMLCYEYNLFEIQRTKIARRRILPTGKVKIEVETVYARSRPAGPLNVTLKVNGKAVAAAPCRSPRRSSSPPTTASTSALTSARRCRWITLTRRRSPSTARSPR